MKWVSKFADVAPLPFRAGRQKGEISAATKIAACNAAESRFRKLIVSQTDLVGQHSAPKCRSFPTDDARMPVAEKRQSFELEAFAAMRYSMTGTGRDI